MPKTLTICIDLDDTLIPNSHRYNEPSWKCGLIITQALGIHSPYARELMSRQYEKDKAMVEEFGFDADRFPLSWVLTYEDVCTECGLSPDPEVSARLRNTAMRFKYGPFRTYPGVHESLQRLKDAGHALHLVTAGDQRLQQRKIEQSGVERFFDGVHIVQLKKMDTLAALAGDHPDLAVMVGDSKRSDIVPAAELGMHAVWVPSNTWNWADAEVKNGSYHTISSFTELPELLKVLMSPPVSKRSRRKARQGGR